MVRLPNKGMKLTRPGKVGASQLIPSVLRTQGGGIVMVRHSRLTLGWVLLCLVGAQQACTRGSDCWSDEPETAASSDDKYTAVVERSNCNARQVARTTVRIRYEEGGTRRGGPVFAAVRPDAVRSKSPKDAGPPLATIKWLEPRLLLVRHEPDIEPILWIEGREGVRVKFEAITKQATP
jgi:hypothetical protein